MAATSASATIVAIPTFTDIDTTETLVITTATIGTRGHTGFRETTQILTIKTQVPTTIFGTLTSASTDAAQANSASHGAPKALIGGIVAGVLLLLVILGFGLFRWRQRAHEARRRRRTSWKIEEGVESASTLSGTPQTTAKNVQSLRAQTLPVVAKSGPDRTPSPTLGKIEQERVIELEHQFEAARVALEASESATVCKGVASDGGLDTEQTWKVKADVLQDEVDRLRTELAAASTAPPPAYMGNRDSVVTQLFVKS